MTKRLSSPKRLNFARRDLWSHWFPANLWGNTASVIECESPNLFSHLGDGSGSCLYIMTKYYTGTASLIDYSRTNMNLPIREVLRDPPRQRNYCRHPGTHLELVLELHWRELDPIPLRSDWELDSRNF